MMLGEDDAKFYLAEIVIAFESLHSKIVKF